MCLQKRVEVKERPLSKKSLDSSDVFILDLGLEVYQWNGKTCNKDEKFRAVQYLQTLKVCVPVSHFKHSSHAHAEYLCEECCTFVLCVTVSFFPSLSRSVVGSRKWSLWVSLYQSCDNHVTSHFVI